MTQVHRSRSGTAPSTLWPAAGVWPGLFTPPRASARAAIARTLVRSAIRNLPVTLALPGGERWGAGGPRLDVIRPEAFFARLAVDGLIGLGEAWMTGDFTAGDWHPAGAEALPTRAARNAGAEPSVSGFAGVVAAGATPGRSAVPSRQTVRKATDELTAALTVFAGHTASLIPRPVQRLRRLWEHRPPPAEEGISTVARSNARRAYDLSNELFEICLDETMSYSSAWFEPGDTFQQAQFRKIDGVLDMAGVGQGTRLIEIGCGWGSLAIRAAQRGARVVGLTLSIEQQDLARRRVAAAGVTDLVEIRLEDYRVHAAAHRADYDAAVSVEMIENVGEAFWPDYFTSVAVMLRPGARFALQSITIGHDRLLATRHGYTWVLKYIFPGGRLPSLTAIDQQLAARTSLRVLESRSLGRFYGPTLRRWRHNFADHLPQVAALGFDETFMRMWTYYLAYCEAGFDAGYLGDWQLSIG